MARPELDLDIRPLTAETWAGLSELFGEGGEASWCWCAFWRTRGAAGGRSEADDNRALLRELATGPGPAPGLVALRGGRIIGWVSLAPRADLPRVTNSKVFAAVDDRPAWAIVCFVVSRSERGQGVAAALLAAAVDYAREQGATVVEGYPVPTEGGRLAASSVNTGTLGMFQDAGFTVVATRQATARSRPRLVVRRELGTGAAGGR